MRSMQFILEDDGMEMVGQCRGMSKISVEHSEVSLNEVLEQFENFLRACGFSFDGKVVIDYEANMVAPFDDGSEI